MASYTYSAPGILTFPHSQSFTAPAAISEIKLAADEQEHDDEWKNGKQCTCNDHRIVCIIESV